MTGERHLTALAGGRVDEPEPPMCATDHCEVRVADEGDLCHACELAKSISDDVDYFEKSHEDYDGGDW